MEEGWKGGEWGGVYRQLYNARRLRLINGDLNRGRITGLTDSKGIKKKYTKRFRIKN